MKRVEEITEREREDRWVRVGRLRSKTYHLAQAKKGVLLPACLSLGEASPLRSQEGRGIVHEQTSHLGGGEGGRGEINLASHLGRGKESEDNKRLLADGQV